MVARIADYKEPIGSNHKNDTVSNGRSLFEPASPTLFRRIVCSIQGKEPRTGRSLAFIEQQVRNFRYGGG